MARFCGPRSTGRTHLSCNAHAHHPGVVLSAALGIIHLGINCSGKASLSILLQLEVTYPGLSGHYTFQQMSGLRINGTSKHAAHLHHAA